MSAVRQAAAESLCLAGLVDATVLRRRRERQQWRRLRRQRRQSAAAGHSPGALSPALPALSPPPSAVSAPSAASPFSSSSSSSSSSGNSSDTEFDFDQLLVDGEFDGDEVLAEERDPSADWTEAIVVPQLYALLQRPQSRERGLALHMVQVLVALRVVGGEVAIGVLLPLVLNAADDVVANVRLAVAKTLHYLVEWTRQGQRRQLVAAAAAAGATSSSSNSGGGGGIGGGGRPEHDQWASFADLLRGHADLEKCLEKLAADEDGDAVHYASLGQAAYAKFKNSEDEVNEANEEEGEVAGAAAGVAAEKDDEEEPKQQQQTWAEEVGKEEELAAAAIAVAEAAALGGEAVDEEAAATATAAVEVCGVDGAVTDAAEATPSAAVDEAWPAVTMTDGAASASAPQQEIQEEGGVDEVVVGEFDAASSAFNPRDSLLIMEGEPGEDDDGAPTEFAASLADSLELYENNHGDGSGGWPGRTSASAADDETERGGI